MNGSAQEFLKNKMDIGVLPPELNAFNSADLNQNPGPGKSQVGAGQAIQLSASASSLQPAPSTPGGDGASQKTGLVDRAVLAGFNLDGNIQGLRGPKAGDVGYLCGSVLGAVGEAYDSVGKKSRQPAAVQNPADSLNAAPKMAMGIAPPRPLAFGL